ncbi:unnamed protein product [Gongylonema pulchrum]|uniref:Acyl_transf_3 domain-containing protein n=1 Tax=Gongylonema pulchrum TaxID=637853 RepID=A0A183CWH2_9BILA|nr:unnamed protein product [Gongylonema pulchrum]
MQNNDEQTHEKAARKRNDIQGLRAVAVIQVVLFHLSLKRFPNGYVGVDVFFILSGFLITMILSCSTQPILSMLINFYSRRIKRICPAYYLTIGLVVLATDLLVLFFDKDSVMNEVQWAMVFATNIRGWYLMTDYAAQLVTYNFLVHTWSVCVEMQFYLIAPFIILLSRNSRIGSAFAILTGIASLYFYCFSNVVDSASFMRSRLWQFLLGGIAYRFSKTKGPYLYGLGSILGSNFFLSADADKLNHPLTDGSTALKF